MILTHDANTSSTYLFITLESDVTLDNLVIKPMITDDLSATYSGFISYDDSLARGSHTHVKADITDFAHTHTKSQISDFSHTHTKADITDFAHTHTKSEISDFSHTHDDRYYTESEIDEKFANAGVSNSDLLAKIYPVGSIYMSVNNVSPASFLGGTWEQLKDRFLLGCGDTYTNGAIGGEATHTLTVDEIPSHNHSAPQITWADLGTGGGGWNNHANQTGATGATGGGKAHNNMPPYLAVYMWKRTA